jgi:multidrug resistance efflux pump
MSEEAPMRRLIIGGMAVVVAVAAVAALAVGGLPGGTGAAATPTPLPPVPATDRVVAEARVVPKSRAAVTAPVPGTVSAVAVTEGQRVAEGTVLLQLDPTAARADVAAAQAALDAAAARSTQATAAVDQADDEVDRAAAAYRAAVAIRDQLPDNASSARERAANADVDGARAGIQAARSARAVATAAAKAAKADEARATVALDAARAAEDRLTIRAPIAGTVADVAVELGDAVTAGPPLVRIAGDGGWTFETTDLTQDGVAAIAEGSPASVTVDGFSGEPIEGRVVSIDAIGEDRQGDIVFTVVVEPSGAVPDGLRWNMVASAQIARAP